MLLTCGKLPGDRWSASDPVRWCHGVIADPIRLHAWIEAERCPVAEPDSTRRCTALLTVPTVEEST